MLKSNSIKTMVCALLLVCGSNAVAQGFQFNLDILIDGRGDQEESEIEYFDQEEGDFYEYERPSITQSDLDRADRLCQDRDYDVATGMEIDGEPYAFFEDIDPTEESFREQFRVGTSSRKIVVYCDYTRRNNRTPRMDFNFGLNIGGGNNGGNNNGGFPGANHDYQPAIIPVLPNGPQQQVAPNYLPPVDANGNPLIMAPADAAY